MRPMHFVYAGNALTAGTYAQAGDLSNELMLSSAWCTFSYNKTTGYSSSKRVTFSPGGTYSVGSRGEGGSSGRSGNMASQHDAAGGGQWRVQNGELYLSEGGDFEHVQTTLRRNSNGYPVIVADGVEYSQCR